MDELLGHPIPVFHASASGRALSKGSGGRWGSGDQRGSGLGDRPSNPRRVLLPPAGWPAITTPGARPGSAQTVLAAPAAKVLLGTRDRHLHAGRPGRGRGLRGDGKRGRESPRADTPSRGGAIPGKVGRLKRLQREPPDRLRPAGAGCRRSRAVRQRGRKLRGARGRDTQRLGALVQGVGGEMEEGKG